MRFRRFLLNPDIHPLPCLLLPFLCVLSYRKPSQYVHTVISSSTVAEPTMYSLRHYIDSWIEVSSQPSSSSLSSTNDDIITTGLRVQQNESHAQNRRTHRRQQQLAASTSALREPGSSQDEYEESESESDHVLSSSNEEMNRQPLANPLLSQNGPFPSAPDAASSSDEDDTSTALGMRISSSPFVPQPNAFSHPPVSRNPSWARATEPSEVSNSSRRTTIRRNSQASVRSNRSTRRQPHQQHSPYNMISPSYQADHDAALRASLSTLLSCAAAARGLPKSEPQQSPASPPRQQPSSFRLVPESVAMGKESGEDEAPPATETNTRRPRKNSYSGPAFQSHTAPAPKKRRSSSPKDRSSGHPSAHKKTRRGTIIDSTSNNPTVMTWVLSAGVVVLFSAISFSAGYMLGREVGRMEMGSPVGDAGITGGGASGTCGQQAVKGGLKRFRWGSSGAGSGILA